MNINVEAIRRYKERKCPKCNVKLEYEATYFCPACGEEWNGDKVIEMFCKEAESEEELSQTDLSVLSFIEEFCPVTFDNISNVESSEEVLKRALKKLEDMGHITKDANGRYWA